MRDYFIKKKLFPFGMALGSIFFQTKKIKYFLWKIFYERLANVPYDIFDWAFMNYGYDYENKDKEPVLEARDEKYRYCIQLYQHSLDRLDVKGKTLLEIGCGRGGGASYMARYMPFKKVTAIDYSSNAIALCRKTHSERNLEFLEGDALNIPFNDNSYDIVLNVESSHCYPDIPKFLSEVKRVLKPGGFFVWTDLYPETMTQKYENVFNEAGLQKVKAYDITENVLRALDNKAINDAKKEIIRNQIPFIIRNIIRSFSGIKDTDIYNSLKDGRTKYYYRLLKKEA